MTTGGGPGRGNLVEDATSFVGRRADVHAVRTMLAEHRLVTLVGIGGVGKTRIALQAAREVAADFAGGVWQVELSYSADGSALEQVIAGEMQLGDIPGNASGGDLWSRISDQPTLIVLDNCDRVVPEIAEIVTDILVRAPAAHIVATSREPIGVSREVVYQVDPFAPVGGGRGGETETSDAVRLFEERMFVASRVTSVTAETRAEIAALCDRLDGLPLAIELAAARTRSLSVGEISQRLSDRFGLLKRGPSDVHPRHRSLRAMLDWSFELCSAEERVVWTRIAVFANAASLEAIEVVCSGGDLQSGGILDVVDSLVQKCVLRRLDDGAVARFGMLDSVREYGLGHLDKADEVVVRSRHLAYYLDLARRAAEDWFGENQPRWSRDLRDDLPNIRSALDYSLNEGLADDSLELVGRLWFFWVACGFQTEGQYWASKALGSHHSADTSEALTASWTLGWLTLIGGDIPKAQALLTTCQARAGAAGDAGAWAFATGLLGAAKGFSGDLDSAIKLYRSAVEDRRSAGDPAGTVVMLFQLAEMQSMAGDPAAASASAADCLDLCAAVGEVWCASYAHWVAGLASYFSGDVEAASHCAVESFRLKLSINDRLGEMLVAELGAWIAASRNDYERAASLLAATERFWVVAGCRLMGFPRLITQRERCQAEVDRHLGVQAQRRARALGRDLAQHELLAHIRGDGQRSLERNGRLSPLLTPRESEVAELVGQGLTNREIADVLVIGRRTVETHVARILAKNSFANRSQLATWVVGQASQAGELVREEREA